MHDELLIETWEDELEQVSGILREEMQDAASLDVALEVDMHTGRNWYEQNREPDKMKIIGITGGVGAGKSTVLEYVKKRADSIVLQADQVGHEVMEPEGSCYRPVVELFGSRILRPDGTIDRGAVAAVVFSDGEKLAALNGIIHRQ